ncbi:CsgG/HfaB family protein [Nostoc sp. PCC 7107]|uniref:CsgG/HfaB family protein n=1 Tax=Nostoc sp. PCC 7107 TaxID=317936 RepID=UPI00029F2FC5|nr:CsgG/HfaB family protein [Nostoc sp. PCC 7107]AFY44384.1 Curli production assembly/transport component CsgG [Nostoc sp. PCC 7107]
MKKLVPSIFSSALLVSINFYHLQPATANQPVSPVYFANSSTFNLKDNNKEKPRIAVLDFDYSNVSDNWIWWWNTSAKGVSDILVNKLFESGNFRVIERSKLEAILAEQNLGASGRIDASTAAKIGKILGVDTILIGSITEFNIERGGGGVSIFGVAVGGGKTSANVKLNVRLVNTSSAEIMAVAEGNGKSSDGEGAVSIRGVSVDTSSRKEAKLLTNATVAAIDQVVQKISSNSLNIATGLATVPTINAVVADVTGGTIILNKGTTDGYRQGLKLSIQRVTRAIKDPTTGKVIRQITQDVGTIEITEADPQSSVAKIISGTGMKVGDVAKPVK